MSSCHLKSHPLRLIERYKSSIQTIKLIEKNCLIFENILLDDYEHFERISSNFNKYLMQYDRISHQIYSHLSQLIIELNNRLKNLTKILYEFDCLIMKCSIWLKTNTKKSILSQLKTSKKQFERFLKQKNLTKDSEIFQINYHQQCLQMDTIEYEHMKLFLASIQLFSSIISFDNGEKQTVISNRNIDQNINQWKEKNKYHVPWLSDEHHRIEKSTSDFDIKAIENCSNDNENKYVHESNLSWSFITAKTKENLMIPSPIHQSTDNSKATTPNIIKSPVPVLNRVRLAIEAIERNTKHFPRGRKS